MKSSFVDLLIVRIMQFSFRFTLMNVNLVIQLSRREATQKKLQMSLD